jgi:hypothetical protein
VNPAKLTSIDRVEVSESTSETICPNLNGGCDCTPSYTWLN